MEQDCLINKKITVCKNQGAQRNGKKRQVWQGEFIISKIIRLAQNTHRWYDTCRNE